MWEVNKDYTMPQGYVISQEVCGRLIKILDPDITVTTIQNGSMRVPSLGYDNRIGLRLLI